jgi:hypothetical protein
VGLRGHTAGRRVDSDDRATGFVPLEALKIQQTALKSDLDQANDPVPAHRRVALVVQEQHAHVAVRRDRLGKDAAVHIGVTARLPHEGPAEIVLGLTREFPLREDRVAWDVRPAGSDDTQRLARGVSVDRLDARPVGGRVELRLHG